MKNLQTLIKMHKLYVDEQRRVLAHKTAEANAIDEAIALLLQTLEEEKARATEQDEGNLLLGAFIGNTLKQLEKLQERRIAKEKEVVLEHDKLASMFEELKRYEIAYETALEERKEVANRKENQTYDEQSSQRHARQNQQN